MRFVETPLAGAYVIEIDRLEDERGFFARTFCTDEFARLGLTSAVAQCSVSSNRLGGTLRGMHYQASPREEAKLVRCTRGEVFDAIVDLRPGSPTRLQWFAAELSADNRRMLFVPEGFAHGFMTLADDSELSYQISVPYHPEAQQGFRWDDPAVGIRWPDTPRRISARDAALPYLSPPGSAA